MMSLTQALRRAVQVSAGQVATICGERQRDWHAVQSRVQRLAGALQQLGVEPEDRCAILALNSDRYYEFLFATPWSGGVFVPINIRLAPPEVEFWLSDSQSKVLFVDDAFLPVVEALEGRMNSVEAIVYLGDGAPPTGMLAYEDLIEGAPEVPDAGRCNDDLAALYYTGGTTGRSKGVMLSHRNLVSNNLNVIGAFGFHRDMSWLHAAPMFHIADGLAVFSVTMAGGSHVFIPAFTPEASLDAIQTYRITHSLLVPTMINMVMNFPTVGDYDLSSLRSLTYGASPMPESVIVRALEVIPECEFNHAYGLTEASPLLTWTGPEYHVVEGPNAGRFKSAGRAVYGVEVRICDDEGNEVPRGEIGEVCGRGPNIMLGYWRQPELTAAAMRGEWLRTGDGGYMDEDGFVYIVDRMKDMIITGGENVYSSEVENAVHQHADVVECAVIGIPNERWGESVHAIVRCRDGATVSEQAIIDHCHKLIAGFKCPRSVSFSEEPMPLSGAGKILKTELRKPFWSKQYKQVN